MSDFYIVDKDVAEKALDKFLYNGKSIREWMQIITSVIEDVKKVTDEIVKGLKQLPSVTTQSKIGRWIDDKDGHGTSCSECDKWYPHSYLAKREIIYCCRCGAKMQEVEK